MQKIKTIKENLCAAHAIACDTIPPHITFGVYENLPIKELLSWVSLFAASHEPLPVHFSHIGLFNGTILFLAPRVNRQLLSFYEGFHEGLEEHATGTGALYSPASNLWVPHTTLFIGDVSDIQKTLPLACSQFSPFNGTIESLSVGCFTKSPDTLPENSDIASFTLGG